MITDIKKTETKKHTLWTTATLLLTLAVLAVFASITIYIDPLFHYHAPLSKYQYPINSEQYQNDGITRHFEYDSIITGSSMTENFKVSEANEIFGADFIKVPFAGEGYKRMNDNFKRAYDAGKDIKTIIWGLDYTRLIMDKDSYDPPDSYVFTDWPVYLYNNNPFDDVNYLFNKSILIDRTLYVRDYTKAGGKTNNFDEYVNWNYLYTFSKEAVLSTYTLKEKAAVTRQLTEEERLIVQDNIRQNVVSLAEEHPETTFYIFFPPYSICYWDELYNDGKVDWRIDAEEAAIKELVKVPNIRLYSFCDNFDLVCNLDHYKDQAHYGEWVNSWMLTWLHNGEHLLTEDNYRKYLNTIRKFYNTYDYDSLR